MLGSFILALNHNSVGNAWSAQPNRSCSHAAPCPLDRKVSTLRSFSSISMATSSGISGMTKTEAKEVCRRALHQKGRFGQGDEYLFRPSNIIGIGTVDCKCHVLQTRFFSSQNINDLTLNPLFSVTLNTSGEAFRPNPAPLCHLPSVNADDCVTGIMLSASILLNSIWRSSLRSYRFSLIALVPPFHRPVPQWVEGGFPFPPDPSSLLSRATGYLLGKPLFNVFCEVSPFSQKSGAATNFSISSILFSLPRRQRWPRSFLIGSLNLSIGLLFLVT